MIIYFLILLLVIGVSCFNNNLYHNKLTLLNSYNNNSISKQNPVINSQWLSEQGW